MLDTSQPIYSITEVPQWIKEHPLPKQQSNDESPFTFPVVDYQELITDSEIHSFRNTYQIVNDSSRIEDASLYLTELHQGTQRLLIHDLTVFRNGQKIDALDSENISAIQRERSLESHITDNRITVSLSIDDLREGDHVQFRSTVVEIQSDHPFHGRHFSTNYSLSWACPVDFQAIRVLNQSAKALSVLYGLQKQQNEPEPEIIAPNSVFEKEYRDLQIERIPDTAPEWVFGSFIQITTKSTWTELSQYLFEYFENNSALSMVATDELENLNLISTDEDIEQKALKVIRFVQNKIRYRGENHGVFTHTPKPPQRTLKKRAGDCKDKSNLMVAMLNAIGVSARMLLVNTSYGKKVHELNPSPYHFNHMIVEVLLNEKSYYIDATIQKQSGNLDYATQLDYGLGLPIAAQGSEPVTIKKSLEKEVFHLQHIFNLSKNTNDLNLKIKRTYHFHRADNMRQYFESNEKTKYQQDFLAWAKTDTGLNLDVINPVSIVEDNNKLNKLEIEEEYQIIDIESTHHNKPIELLTDFYHDFPTPSEENFPIRIDLDGAVKHEIFAVYDKRPEMQLSKEKISTQHFDYFDTVEAIHGNKIHYLIKVKPLKEYVEPGEHAKQHKKDVERMRLRSNNLIKHKNKGWLPSMSTDYVWIIIVMAYVIFVFTKS